MRAQIPVAVAVVVVVATFVAGGLTPVLAQSLGDVARKEEERRKTMKAPTKVYTNKDLGGFPVGAPTPPPPDASKTAPATATGGSGTSTGQASAADAEKEKAGQKDQKFWAERMRGLREALDRDQVYAAAIQTQINSLTTDFVNRDDPAQRSVIEQQRNRATAELAKLNESIAKGKKAIAAAEEEARRANVPAGWLR